MGRPRSDPIELINFGKKFKKDLLDYHGVSGGQLARLGSGLTRDIVSQMVAGNRSRLTPKNFLRCIEGLVRLEKLTEEDVVRDWLEELYIARGIRYGDREYKPLKATPEGREILELIKQIQERQQKAHEKPQYTTSGGIPVIGRDQDIRNILDRLQVMGERFIALVGVPGVGKSELARQIEILLKGDRYDTKTISLDEKAVSSNELIHDIEEYLKRRGNSKQVLLVLNNCEKIEPIDEARTQIPQLPQKFPQLTILATSRIAFNPRTDYPVASLTPPKSVDEKIKSLLDNEAMQLFLEGADRYNTAFLLTEENAPYIAALCIGLGGLPLGLLIAGSWIRKRDEKTLCEMLFNVTIQDLNNPFRLEDMNRHITLDRLIEVSYELLEDRPEQRLFRQLGIFAGECNIEAVQMICTFDGLLIKESDMLNRLDELARHNLIYFVNNRVQIAHPTLQDYAWRKLFPEDEEEKNEEGDAITQVFIRYYNALVTPYWIERYARQTDQEDLEAFPPLLYKLGEWAAYPCTEEDRLIELKHRDLLRSERANINAAYQKLMVEKSLDIIDELERRLRALGEADFWQRAATFCQRNNIKWEEIEYRYIWFILDETITEYARQRVFDLVNKPNEWLGWMVNSIGFKKWVLDG